MLYNSIYRNLYMKLILHFSKYHQYIAKYYLLMFYFSFIFVS